MLHSEPLLGVNTCSTPGRRSGKESHVPGGHRREEVALALYTLWEQGCQDWRGDLTVVLCTAYGHCPLKQPIEATHLMKVVHHFS